MEQTDCWLIPIGGKSQRLACDLLIFDCVDGQSRDVGPLSSSASKGAWKCNMLEKQVQKCSHYRTKVCTNWGAFRQNRDNTGPHLSGTLKGRNWGVTSVAWNLRAQLIACAHSKSLRFMVLQWMNHCTYSCFIWTLKTCIIQRARRRKVLVAFFNKLIRLSLISVMSLSEDLSRTSQILQTLLRDTLKPGSSFGRLLGKDEARVVGVNKRLQKQLTSLVLLVLLILLGEGNQAGDLVPYLPLQSKKSVYQDGAIQRA